MITIFVEPFTAVTGFQIQLQWGTVLKSYLKIYLGKRRCGFSWWSNKSKKGEIVAVTLLCRVSVWEQEDSGIAA